jgi:hypothetical protein
MNPLKSVSPDTLLNLEKAIIDVEIELELESISPSFGRELITDSLQDSPHSEDFLRLALAAACLMAAVEKVNILRDL